MFTRNKCFTASTLAAVLLVPSATFGANEKDVEKLIADWPAGPQLGARQMLEQYGPPMEATSEQLIWHDEGPYKRITVTRVEHHHDFPTPHMDFLEHTVHYDVPSEKVSEITAYDGSVTLDRTRGEMSARCDLEGHNILSLNIAHDIVTGKHDAQSAQKTFGEVIAQDMLGKKPAYVTALQFKPATAAAADPGKPVIPGSPVRAAKTDAQAKGDAEVLAYLDAVNTNEIVAAMAADKEKLSPQVAEYARKMHMEHGKNLVSTLEIGEKIGVTPVKTPAVEQLRAKGTGELATLVPLDGNEFGKAYITAQVKQHGETLKMIDGQLMKSAQSDAVKAHLKQTREHVAMHLEQAKKLQDGGAMRQASDQ